MLVSGLRGAARGAQAAPDAGSRSDLNDNGQIGAAELRILLLGMQVEVTEADAQDMINSMDADGSGMLSFPEFLNLMASNLGDSVDEEHDHVFARFDADGDGLISPDDLFRASTALDPRVSREDVEEMVGEVDTTKKGKITKRDFHAALKP